MFGRVLKCAVRLKGVTVVRPVWDTGGFSHRQREEKRSKSGIPFFLPFLKEKNVPLLLLNEML